MGTTGIKEMNRQSRKEKKKKTNLKNIKKCLTLLVIKYRLNEHNTIFAY